MILLLLFSFLAGLVTILTPCIWPLLPIVLSASISGGGKSRPLGIALGVTTSFAVITLTISTLVRIFHLDPNFLRFLAVIVIGFLGITLLFPRLSQPLEFLTGRLSGLVKNPSRQGTDFGAGLVTGIALGAIWSPCAGPILAAIASLSSLGQVNFNVILITLFYVLGIGIPLFFVAYGGQVIFSRLHFLSRKLLLIQKVFGVIMILTAVAIYTNFDILIQNKLLDLFPSLNATVNSFENSTTVTKQLDILKGQTASTLSNAPDFVGITNWLNTPAPITIQQLRGQVVLVDFWTYTCINCIRTIPHLNDWYAKYHDKGFTVIGVHTPEFEFEKDTNNVKQAIKQFGIIYPVAQDNNYATWNNYHNNFWPADYLIDSKGQIRDTQFGEGDYAKTESEIQSLLVEAGKTVKVALSTIPDQTPTSQISPETYLGSDRMQFYYPSGQLSTGTQNLNLSGNPSPDSFSLGGQWTIGSQNSVSGQGAVLVYNFTAHKVFLVMRPGSAKAPVFVKVLLDNQLVTQENSGSDVHNGIVLVNSDRLYNLIDLKDQTRYHLLRLEFQSPGTEVFAFTFG